MDSLWNVTPVSLVTWVGVLDDGNGDYADPARSVNLKAQLGILQSNPMPFQMNVYSEVAAKYLPSLVNLFRQRPEALGSVTTLINVISTTYTVLHSFFFVALPGAGLAALQAKRVASAVGGISTMNADEVGEIGQFLATLLLLQGVQDVAEEDKTIILQHCPIWARRFPGRLASDTAGRCQALLNNDPSMRQMLRGVKDMLESKLDRCGGPGCTRTAQKDGSDLSQCGRCKSAVYVSVFL
ncbi:hypothetical protein B0H14DRAFT_3429419 [Mycena olivaceomarginata]|nr:hypothetical protein B0H14DRAFT_3429419 [Mycena olivaceomarginata]